MFGLFGKFGRSRDLRRLDEALRAVDLHPAMVPEAVKLAAVRLLKARSAEDPPPEAYGAAAGLLAFCMLGQDGFAAANGIDEADAMEARLEAAVQAGDSLDAEIVLLTMHAGLIQPGIVAEYGLESFSN